MYSDSLLLPWFRPLADQRRAIRIFDSHMHLGANDPEGWICGPDDVLEALSTVDGRGVVFPLMEPAGYRKANDAVLCAAAASEGRLVPFCRIDPHGDPAHELERCLAGGARGVKLHPRAERFDLRHPGVADVFGMASERRLPITIHCGLGIPSLGRDALTLSERYPTVPIVLAHVGVTDLAWIWRRLDEYPNLFFDTAWWSPADHLALFALVPPGRVLLGSDTPFGTPAAAATVAIRCALHAGLTSEQVGSVVGGQLERLLAGEEAHDLGPAPRPKLPHRPPLLERVFALLVAALSRMLEGVQADGLVRLARLGCTTDGNDEETRVLESIGELLDRQQGYAATTPLDGQRAGGFHLVLVAASLAAAPSAPLPKATE